MDDTLSSKALDFLNWLTKENWVYSNFLKIQPLKRQISRVLAPENSTETYRGSQYPWAMIHASYGQGKMVLLMAYMPQKQKLKLKQAIE